MRGSLPEVSWLFFKARAKRPYLNHTGRASNAEKQPTGAGPKGCDENGPAAALRVGYVQHQFDVSPRKPARYLQTSNWCGLLPPTASPARTALPAAHFDRNKLPAISGDRTLD